MAKNLSNRAQAIESHISMALLLRNNWPAIVTTLGISGFNGFLVWLGQAAAHAPWYQKLLFATLGVCVSAFLITGFFAFLSTVFRRAKTENDALARNIRWSGHTYSPGAVIEGGTHSVADIFGTDRSRSRLFFRNAQIDGPGTVWLFGCHMEHNGFLAAGVTVVIEPKSGGLMGSSTHVFWQCRFDNCTFVDVVCVGDLGFDPAQVAIFKLEQVTVEGQPPPELTRGPEAE